MIIPYYCVLDVTYKMGHIINRIGPNFGKRSSELPGAIKGTFLVDVVKFDPDKVVFQYNKPDNHHIYRDGSDIAYKYLVEVQKNDWYFFEVNSAIPVSDGTVEKEPLVEIEYSFTESIRLSDIVLRNLETGRSKNNSFINIMQDYIEAYLPPFPLDDMIHYVKSF